MKKILGIFMTAMVIFSLWTTVAFAEGIDLSELTDTELSVLYNQVRGEMLERGMTISEIITLREGKFIVGEDILPGTYKITCMMTEGETLGGLYSSFGQAYNSLGEDDGLGALMGALGGMMEEITPTTVEIIGDYGTVLKSFEMKKGDVTYITLNEKTALQISGGSCTLEPN